MSDLVITMKKRIDRVSISNATTIDFVNEYAAEPDALTTTTYGDLSVDEKAALLLVLDHLTNEIEAGAKVWNVARTGKTFDLSGSYIRDDESTEPLLTVMPTGESLLVRFEIPGFLTNQVETVSLWYNQVFDSGDVTALAALGIELTGDGKVFEIVNDTEVKVSFLKPELVTDLYIINDLEANNVIPV